MADPRLELGLGEWGPIPCVYSAWGEGVGGRGDKGSLGAPHRLRQKEQERAWV